MNKWTWACVGLDPIIRGSRRYERLGADEGKHVGKDITRKCRWVGAIFDGNFTRGTLVGQHVNWRAMY
jgi:hypothetical protein